MEEQPDSDVCSVCLQDPQAKSCPQCRQTSSSGTDPDQSVLSIAERLERTDLQTGEGQAEAADMEGDACAVRNERAMISCPESLASSSTRTDLSTGAAQLPEDNTERIQVEIQCSQHDKPLEVYCRTDQQCICFLCLLDDHNGHDAVSVAAGRAEKQRQLEETKKKVADRETELNDIKKSTDILKNLNQATEEECDRIFTELIDFIQTSHTETITLLQNHTRVEMERIQGHVDGLEEMISELKRKHSELDQLSHTDDHISYLQKIQSYCSTSQHEDSSLTINPHFSFGEIIKSLSSLTAQIQDIWRLEIGRTFSAVKRDQILLPTEPKTREDFLKFLVPLSLDPNTAHRNLCLTEQNRSVMCSTGPQSYPEHSDRFQWWAQVLTNEGLTGRCYWEVVWTGQHGVDIAVAYKDIRRTGDGDDSGFGYNKHSWSLDCSSYRCALVHNNTETAISGPVSNRIGVYLEHRAGLLSFYSITDTMKLLHSVHNNRFTQPIYPGFGLLQGSTAKFCGPE
nr:tripartite motif-containing protein 16 isoform X1 [Misgurnus anguillicaudatus]